MRRSRRVPLAGWLLGGSSIALACSLTVPEEDEFFGSDGSEKGGAAGSKTGGAGGGAGLGGNAPQGGTAGSPKGGAGEAGMETAGQGGAGGDAGGAGLGGAAGASAGAGGTPEMPGAGQAGMGGEGGGVVPFVPDEGLVAHYRFDETTGTVAEDAVGTADASVNGTATWTETGKIGGALSLSGASSYVDVPPAFLSAREAITVSIWYNQASPRVLWTRVLDFGSSQTHWMYYSPAAQPPNQPQGTHAALDVSNYITAEIHMPDAFPAAGQWTHVAIAWSKTEFSVYVDGALAAEDTEPLYTPGEFATLTPGAETLRAWIGRSSFAADAYFTGMVDDFRIYDRALTASDVAQLYVLEE